MTIDKLNPDTWERTGRKTFDGAPVILNPVTGVQCVMPRPSWPNPRVPRNISQYVREARERGVEAATPEAMANAVFQVLSRYRDFSDFARERAISQFALEVFVEKHRRIFEKVLET